MKAALIKSNYYFILCTADGKLWNAFTESESEGKDDDSYKRFN